MIGFKPTNPLHPRAAIGALLLVVAFSANAQDPLRPTFRSEVAVPNSQVILPLLKAACGEGVRTVTEKGETAFGCGDSMDEILKSRRGAREFDWSPYVLWRADGVIFGHFLSPTSDDVAINCFACETHPALWGGTLLLTRKSGKWRPVWYKAGIITRHCRRIPLVTGRQILFCEETDGGMGHNFHGLYIVDFQRPKFAWHSVVLNADNYSYGDTTLRRVQKQSVDRVSFDETAPGGLLVRIYARHGRVKLRVEYGYQPLPVPKVSQYEVDFRLDGATLKVTPETAAAARLFGVNAR